MPFALMIIVFGLPFTHATMRLMKHIFATLLLALATIVAASAQTATAPPTHQETSVSVPFVGCPSYGQIERLEPPKGTSRTMRISSANAKALAYYRSADGIGVLAPRGWYCEGASGSGGYALFLGPKQIQHGGSGWQGLDGPAIEVNHMTSENSGRYEIAEVMARVFPAYRVFARRLMKGMDIPLPTDSYPKDTLARRGEKIVEYNTPAQTEGLGNFHSWIGKSDLPISGVAIIIDDSATTGGGPDLVLLSVRLPHALTGLTPVIVGQLERDTSSAGRR
jgi:hypothetical protein